MHEGPAIGTGRSVEMDRGEGGEPEPFPQQARPNPFHSTRSTVRTSVRTYIPIVGNSGRAVYVRGSGRLLCFSCNVGTSSRLTSWWTGKMPSYATLGLPGSRPHAGHAVRVPVIRSRMHVRTYSPVIVKEWYVPTSGRIIRTTAPHVRTYAVAEGHRPRSGGDEHWNARVHGTRVGRWTPGHVCDRRVLVRRHRDRGSPGAIVTTSTNTAKGTYARTYVRSCVGTCVRTYTSICYVHCCQDLKRSGRACASLCLAFPPVLSFDAFKRIRMVSQHRQDTYQGATSAQ